MNGQSPEIHLSNKKRIRSWCRSSKSSYEPSIMPNKCLHSTFYFYLSHVLGAAIGIRLQPGTIKYHRRPHRISWQWPKLRRKHKLYINSTPFVPSFVLHSMTIALLWKQCVASHPMILHQNTGNRKCVVSTTGCIMPVRCLPIEETLLYLWIFWCTDGTCKS